MRPLPPPVLPDHSPQTHPRHYCGLFGVYGHPRAAELTFYGLYALQHRGQESAGIVACRDNRFHVHRGMGLVPQVFNSDILERLPGPMAIGHTRYSTTGDSHPRNAQPLTAEGLGGPVAVAHNGNLTNAARLRAELERQGAIFQTTTDSEIILHLLSHPANGSREPALSRAIRHLQGAFSLLLMTHRELIGIRDPHGFRPLSLGRIRLEDGRKAWVLASETCAFDLIEAEHVRDVDPGEAVIIDENGPHSVQLFPEHRRRAFCIFEYVYFARPDSIISGRNVHQVRVAMGRQLAREHPRKADIVVPIPDSGNCAALGYSLESGIPFEMAFVRNHYVGRSFLQPSELIRHFNVRVKLNLIADLVRGRRVVVVDDSIVRGNTCRQRVTNLKEAGAKEVHVLVSCPPHQHPCYYGIDFPQRSQLMAAQHSLEEIRKFLRADSLGYLSQEGMVEATGLSPDSFCMACYDGCYPVACEEPVRKEAMEDRAVAPWTLGRELIEADRQRRLF
ncbi:MAG: amidophosphoribosyltransferase [Verrucomicrobia bacterium]|nr:MAG: amidophosphoribosyltransferase [Verrucomicrobiota bacterium]